MEFRSIIISASFSLTIISFWSTVSAQDFRITKLDLDRTEIWLPCRPGMPTKNDACKLGAEVVAKVAAAGSSRDVLRFHTTVSGGRIVSSTTSELKWDLAGLAPGAYTLTVAAVDKKGRLSETRTVTVTVAECPGCVWEDSCPTVSLEAPEGIVEPGATAIFRAKVSALADSVTFNWTVSAGSIVSGQGTPQIGVSVDGSMAGGNITATVEIGGQSLPGFCSGSGTTSASETIAVSHIPKPVLVDEFATVGTNCEESNARMDQYFAEVSNNPSDRAVIVIYESPKGRAAAAHREALLRNFIRFRRFDPSRFTFVRGPFRDDAKVQFWRIPPGSSDPEILPQNVDPPILRPVPETDSSKPYHYATEYSDGLPECQVPMYDLAEYAAVLNTEPRSRGRIIIGQSSRARFARKQREILAELSAAGVARARLTFVYKYVRPNRALEMTELWVVPVVKKVREVSDQRIVPEKIRREGA